MFKTSSTARNTATTLPAAKMSGRSVRPIARAKASTSTPKSGPTNTAARVSLRSKTPPGPFEVASCITPTSGRARSAALPMLKRASAVGSATPITKEPVSS